MVEMFLFIFLFFIYCNGILRLIIALEETYGRDDENE